jgi:hypothetical protein
MPTRKLTYVPASVKGNIVNTNVDKADSSEATEISACRKKGRRLGIAFFMVEGWI